MDKVRQFQLYHAGCTGADCDDYWRGVASQIWDENFDISSGNKN